MDFFEVIKTRRSVRKYTSDPVEDEKIEAILEAGRWAPSWSNTQCWRFIVVRDTKVKEQLAQTLMRFKLPDKEIDNPAISIFNTVPVIIVVCAEMGRSGGPPGSTGDISNNYFSDKGDWFMFDTALAVENMVLTAHALGLGTVIIGTADAASAERVLNLPPNYRFVTMFPVGVPAQPGKVPPRKELSEILRQDRWTQ